MITENCGDFDISVDDMFICLHYLKKLQQDIASAHVAVETVRSLQQKTPEFTWRDLWPPNSPELNSADY